jgi:hypothetical protein
MFSGEARRKILKRTIKVPAEKLDKESNNI